MTNRDGEFNCLYLASPLQNSLASVSPHGCFAVQRHSAQPWQGDYIYPLDMADAT